MTHQLTIVIEVHGYVQVDLLLFLNFDAVIHLAVVNWDIEVDLVLLLDLHVIHHFTVVVIVYGDVEVVLLLLLNFNRVHLAFEVLLE